MLDHVFSHYLEGNAKTFLLNFKNREGLVSKNRLVISKYIDREANGVPIVPRLCLKPLRYSQHCVITLNSEVNYDVSMEPFFFGR